MKKTAGLAALIRGFAIEDRPKIAQAGREIAKIFFLKAIEESANLVKQIRLVEVYPSFKTVTVDKEAKQNSLARERGERAQREVQAWV